MREYRAMLAAARRARDPEYIARAHGNIGALLCQHGDYAQARRHFERMLAICESNKALDIDPGPLNNLGALYMEVGDLDASIDYYSRSLSLERDRGDVRGQLEDLKHLGFLYHVKRDWVKAAKFFESALGLLDAVEASDEMDPQIARRTRHALLALQAQNLFVSGDQKRALELFLAALRLAQASENREGEAEIKLALAKAMLTQGESLRAREYAQDALALSERIGLTELAWQARLFLGKLYQKEARLREAESQYQSAIEIIESERLKLQDGNLSLPFLAKRYDAYKAMALLQRKGLKDDIMALVYVERSKARALLDKLTLASSSSLTNKPPITIRQMAEIQASLPVNLTVLEYFFGDGELFIFTIGKNLFRCASVALEEAELDKMVESFILALQRSDAAGIKDKGRRLYEHLIYPIKSDLRPNDVICIVPDGSLFLLPFAALIAENGRFLIEDHALSYAPSIAALKCCLDLKRGDVGGRRKILVVSGGSPPEALLEAKLVAHLYHPLATSLTEVKEREFIGLIDKHDIVHFSGHAALAAGQLPTLFLTSGDSNETIDSLIPAEDGRLLLSEIIGSRFSRVRLITLSACETGSGRYWRGEGLMSLAYGLFSSAAPALLVSIWKIDDLATKLVMESFYKLLLAGCSKVEALRQAQLALMRSHHYSPPYFWAPFLIMGDPR